jgi:hypothetical protein
MYAMRFPAYHATSSLVFTPSICTSDVVSYWFDLDLHQPRRPGPAADSHNPEIGGRAKPKGGRSIGEK